MDKHNHVWRVLCEWDIGLEDTVFETWDLAYESTKDALVSCDIDDPIDDLLNEGLVSFRQLALIMEKEDE